MSNIAHLNTGFSLPRLRLARLGSPTHWFSQRERILKALDGLAKNPAVHNDGELLNAVYQLTAALETYSGLATMQQQLAAKLKESTEHSNPHIRSAVKRFINGMAAN